jgi:hypothetical protein
LWGIFYASKESIMPIRREATPEMFPDAWLLATDFDQTVALTFEKSPAGMGVHEACETAVDAMFGPKALDLYRENGGLRNRAPLEVVQDLAPDVHGQDLDKLTSTFTKTKLDIFVGEIGTRFPNGSLWPRPTIGYIGLLENLEAAADDGHRVDNLILSSGNELFIKKTYQAWGLSAPPHIIAEETIRGLGLTLPAEQLVKPSPLLMEVARTAWRQSYGIEAASVSADDERGRIVYVGDDPHKDGKLAVNSGIDFVLLDPANSLESWQDVASRLQIGRIILKGSD